MVSYKIFDIYEDGSVFKNKAEYITDSGRKLSLRARWLKPLAGKGGFPVYSLSYEEETERLAIHRLIATYFVPNPNGYKYVRHIDGNKNNNHCNNLEWVSDEYHSSRTSSGVLFNSGYEERKEQILKYKELGMTNTSIIEKLNIPKTTYYRILKMK